MRLSIDTALSWTKMENPGDLKRLDAIVTGNEPTDAALAGIGRRDGDHIWVDVEALRRLAGDQPTDWHIQFDGMIAYAVSKGWTNPDGTEVRVHIAAA